MRLSEAMRLGSMAVPPMHGPSIARDENGRVCGACAIGAALYAVGRLDGDWLSDDAIRALPLMAASVKHPTMDCGEMPLSRAVIHLFESVGWSREQIADWVESIEAQMDPEGRAAHPSAEADPLCAPPEIQTTTSAI